jgi:hypothetical protein
MNRCCTFTILALWIATFAAAADAPSDDRRLAQLTQLLDQWVPVGPGDGPPGRERVMVAQLASDDPKVRERATQELIDMADTHSGLVERACESDDPEVRLRAQHVAMARGNRPPIDWAERVRHEVAADVQSRNDVRSLRIIADRAIAVLQAGLPARGPSDLVVRELLKAVARSRDEALANRFLPLLRHEDVRVAVLVTRMLGQPHFGNGYYPPFLLRALASDRAEVVESAINSGPAPVADRDRLPQIHEAYRKIFEGDNDRLRFAASFTLMQTFGDADVFPYLLEQSRSTDRGRRSDALSHLGDACNVGRPAWPALVEATTPLAVSKDVNDRRAAVRILRCYVGRETAALLVPMLVDPQSIVASEAQDGLLERPDVDTVRAALDAAMVGHADAALRAMATEVRGKLRPTPGG